MAHSIIKACIDRNVPEAFLHAKMNAAVRENAANAPAISRRGLPFGVMPDIPRAFLAAITGKLWRPGRTLRVRFLDGDPLVQERIPPFAKVWSEHANVEFDFVDDTDAEIRISFQHQGSWSYIGTDALVIPLQQPTMNFGWLNRSTSDEEYARVVTHEFGHALGCIHEHQNPATDIPWDKEVVYAYYQGPPNFWTREQVDINLFTRYEEDITQFSEFDPESIMLYPIPNEFTVGDFEVGWNQQLSETDMSFISTVYPAVRKAAGQLVPNGIPVDASIGSYGEVDTYSFDIDLLGRYRLETGGETDVVMSLFGPNDLVRMVDTDDDSGPGRNARIIANLRPGSYIVRVRHYSTNRTGNYRLGLYRE